MTKKIKAIMIIGQTCSGKESLALKLAEALHTEIISMDSMKIYHDMNIGTAKAPPEARKKVKHHMLDIIAPSQDYNIKEYLDEATTLAKNFTNSNKIPLFSGGTSLYAKALLTGLFSIPEIPDAIKEKVAKEYDLDKEKTYQRLQIVDAAACKKIFMNDRQRVTRALEVFDALHQPISTLQNQFNNGSEIFEFLCIGLRWPREKLHKRIEQRVHWMLESGLEQEVQAIMKKYPTLGVGAAKAVGYQELIAYFNGHCTREEAIERIIINTRQLCKHQMTWMKKFPIYWIDVDENVKAAEIFGKAHQIIKDSHFVNEML